MNKQAMWAIAKKDMLNIKSNLQVWLPMLILPIIFGVAMPAGFTAMFSYGDLTGGSTNLAKTMEWINRFPIAGLSSLPTANMQMAYAAANFMLAPFFLLIPLMTSSVITADSFAGEKERGTLETLLFAPVDLLSMFTGKVLAAFIPSMLLSLGSFVTCAMAVNAVGWPQFHRVFFPTLNWLPLMLLVIPLVSLLTILVNIFISARVASFQAAYQMGGMMVLPFIVLLLGQVTGFLMLGTTFMLVLSAALAILDGLLMQFLLKRLNRTMLFESQIR